MDRRKFLINNSKVAIGMTLIPTAGFSITENTSSKKFKSNRKKSFERIRS